MTEATPAMQAAEALPIAGTLREILDVACSEIGRWAVLALIALILDCIAIFYLVPALMGGPAGAFDHPWDNDLAQIVTGLIYVAPATAWIRDVTTGKPTSGLQFQWGSRELNYILRGIQLFLLIVILVLLLGGLADFVVSKLIYLVPGGGLESGATGATPVTLATMFPKILCVGLIGLLMWLTADFVMVLPAAANGDDSSFRRSAALTCHHRWRIVAIGLISSAAMFVIAALINFLLVLVAVLLTKTTAAMALSYVVKPQYFAIATVVEIWFSTLIHTTGLGCVYRRLTRAAPTA